MTHLVFVFGTLKEGFPNFATNRGKRVAGEFSTVKRYPLYLIGERFSPWLVFSAGEGERVAGQVFEVDQGALNAMDVLERVTEADGYRRVSIAVERVDGESRSVLSVQAYVKAPEHFRAADVKAGPLGEYTMEHAGLYRSRPQRRSAADSLLLAKHQDQCSGMNKKARRAALLARMASAQLEPVRSFDANCMVRISGCQSVLEVLQSIKHGGPQWAHRYVTVWFSNPANAWVQVYCSQDGSAPYFDVMYTRKEPPQEALSLVLARYPQCDVIDWSPGRLACIRAQDVDIETLAEVIRHVAEAAWGERLAFAGASYEEMGRA